MLREAVYHKPVLDYAYALDSNTIALKIRVKKQDVKEINVYVTERYDWSVGEEITSMYVLSSDDLFDYYEAVISVSDRRICYIFELKGENEVWYYGEDGFTRDKPQRLRYFQVPYIQDSEIIKVPEWVKNAIFYQIFPERFCNGEPTNPHKKRTDDWYAEPKRTSVLGGDLKGIIDKLDYLKDLGITAIYMTPIFESINNHKYDTIDYYKIDPRFGDLETFKLLVKEAHSRDIKIVLDAVFNHCALQFFAFQDVIEKGKDSAYIHWFNIYEFPIKIGKEPTYECYGNVPYMPKLMTKHPEVRKYFCEVAQYWITECDIDGWRLDVANEIDHVFWKEFRRAVKEVKDDAYIVGEIWYDSTEWLNGDEYDSVMNYRFTQGCLEFFARGNWTAKEFDEYMGAVRSMYKIPVRNVMLNLLDSHDTPRFLHEANEKIAKLKLAAAYQMTYNGSPMIYYGDEVGMTGGHEPKCRGGMLWDESKQNIELLNFYKQLIQLRKQYSCLRLGEYHSVYVDEQRNIYGYIKQDTENTILILLNNSEQSHELEIVLQKKYKEIVSLLGKSRLSLIDMKLKGVITPYDTMIVRLK